MPQPYSTTYASARRVSSEVLDTTVTSHRALKQPLCGFNKAYNGRRQRVLNGRMPDQVVAERPATRPRTRRRQAARARRPLRCRQKGLATV